MVPVVDSDSKLGDHCWESVGNRRVWKSIDFFRANVFVKVDLYLHGPDDDLEVLPRRIASDLLARINEELSPANQRMKSDQQ